MGLTIYYNCTFKPSASLKEMIEEVKDVAQAEGWKYFAFKDEFPAKAKGKKQADEEVNGILFTPPGSEPVTLCFLANGKLCNPFLYDYWLKKEKGKKPFTEKGGFTKTQYAGAETHIKVLKFLRYLSKKYFNRFKLIDEGGYWESGDEALLHQTFKEWNAMMDAFADELETIKLKKGETIESAIKRAAARVHKRRKS